jgi:hypothetical protein
MRERLQVVALTTVVFVAGLLVGIWTQRARPLPPLPNAPMEEFGPPGLRPFSPPPPPAPWMLGFGVGAPISPSDMRIRLHLLEPQIKEFRKRVAVIEAGFRTQFSAMLDPKQQRKLADLSESMPTPQGPLPGCAGEAGNPFIPMIIYRPVLDHLSEILSMDPAQYSQLKIMLIERRTRLLTLVDQTPPPSFKLGKILEESTASP